MPLQTTPLTAVPLTPAGTIDQPTWGETGGPFAIPPNIGPGLGAEVLLSNTVNYEWQHPARHIRAYLDRLVLADEGLFTSCVVREGVWNVAGGTLNATLTPTRLVVDFAMDGGAVYELYAFLATPQALPALSDSYVDINEAGVVTVVSVGNLVPEPAVTANSVRFYKLITNGVQLTSAALVPAIPAFPCFGPVTGMRVANINELNVITSLAVSLATIETLDVTGNTTLGTDNADTVTVPAVATFVELVNATLGIRGAAATPVNAPEGIRAAVATPLALPEGATVAAGKPITGGVGSIPDFEVYQLQSEKAASGDRQIHHLGGEPRWKDSDDGYLHHGTEPWGPVGSVPALDGFGPTSAEIDGPSVEVTLTGTAFIFVSASGVFVGTAGDTEAGIRVEVDGIDVYDLAFPVFNTDRSLAWATSFTVQEGAGTFDVKIKFRRSAGSGSVNLGSSSIFAMPT